MAGGVGTVASGGAAAGGTGGAEDATVGGASPALRSIDAFAHGLIQMLTRSCT